MAIHIHCYFVPYITSVLSQLRQASGCDSELLQGSVPGTSGLQFLLCFMLWAFAVNFLTA